MLSSSLNDYSINMNQEHQSNTKQKLRKKFYYSHVSSEIGKKPCTVFVCTYEKIFYKNITRVQLQNSKYILKLIL